MDGVRYLRSIVRQYGMKKYGTSSLSEWTPQQIEQGRKWVASWERAGVELEKIRREELRNLDGARAIELLSGPADYFSEPRAPKPTSGLIEQQYWFMKARQQRD